MTNQVQPTTANPPVTPLLRWVTTFESGVVLFSGFGLLFLLSVVGPLWPWSLTPFNAAFLGSLYLTSAVAACALSWMPRWSPARVILPMILLFTSVVLLVSLLYLDRFILSSPSTWLWFVLYITIPLNSAYHVWLYRHLPPVNSRPLPVWYRNLLWVEIIIFTLYGIALFMAPEAASVFWPWKLDDFHGRMYCVAFLTPAIGAYMVRWYGTKTELVVMGLSQIVGGVLTLVGFLMVELVQKRTDWSAPGTWLWLAFFPLLVIVGGVMVRLGQRQR